MVKRTNRVVKTGRPVNKAAKTAAPASKVASPASKAASAKPAPTAKKSAAASAEKASSKSTAVSKSAKPVKAAESAKKNIASGKARFFIQSIYIKDFSFESPNAPGIFKERAEPSVNLDLNNKIKELAADTYEVTLTITVTVSEKDKTAFLVEIEQAGIFHIAGLTEEQLNYTLNSRCPDILYPYARATVTDMVVRGGFPQLMLSVINFDVLYRQQLKKEKGDLQPEGKEIEAAL